MRNAGPQRPPGHGVAAHAIGIRDEPEGLLILIELDQRARLVGVGWREAWVEVERAIIGLQGRRKIVRGCVYDAEIKEYGEVVHGAAHCLLKYGTRFIQLEL